jgi:hypothetical protein
MPAAYDFPIRPGRIAQVVIPRDLTRDEADRLCRFVATLATPESPAPVFVLCPRCGARSFHPKDIAEGYCGACHDWTGPT